MTTPLALLLTPETADQIEQRCLDLLELAGFQVTAWQEGSAPNTIIRWAAETLADVWLSVYFVASGGYGQTARGDALELWGEDRFGLPRNGVATAVGKVTLTDVGGGPHSISVGGVVITTTSGKQYVNTDTGGGTLALDGSLELTFQAVAAGAAYNVPNGSTLSLVTDLPTVTAETSVQTSGTWLTTSGADEETDAAYLARCLAQWGLLSVATPNAYYVAKAMEAAPTISKVRVKDDNPNGPGTVELVIANSGGAATAGEISAVNTALQAQRSVGSGALTVITAVATTVDIEATVYVTSAQLDAAESQIDQLLADYEAELEIGGSVLTARLIEILMAPDGVRNAVLSEPAEDTGIGDDNVATFNVSITYVAE
jgi:uncharacterized phage protein gp47/JayE